jgi:hypothetical protein
MLMLFTSFLSWWYGAGWQQAAGRARHRLHRATEFFSLGLLVRTLFSPYRQISAGGVRGNLTIKWHAFIDRSVSRIIGAVVRTFVLLAGVVSLTVLAGILAVWLVCWPILPLLPVVCIGLTVSGVTL